MVFQKTPIPKSKMRVPVKNVSWPELQGGITHQALSLLLARDVVYDDEMVPLVVHTNDVAKCSLVVFEEGVPSVKNSVSYGEIFRIER